MLFFDMEAALLNNSSAAILLSFVESLSKNKTIDNLSNVYMYVYALDSTCGCHAIYTILPRMNNNIILCNIIKRLQRFQSRHTTR